MLSSRAEIHGRLTTWIFATAGCSLEGMNLENRKAGAEDGEIGPACALNRMTLPFLLSSWKRQLGEDTTAEQQQIQRREREGLRAHPQVRASEGQAVPNSLWNPRCSSVSTTVFRESALAPFKAVEDYRNPRPGGFRRGGDGVATASWSAPVLWRFASGIPFNPST
jgi:hypothetical protein